LTETTATVQNTHGIHCRPSALIVEFASQYDGSIDVSNGERHSDLRSILELMALELFCGTTVTIRVEGPDEQKTCQDLVALFEKHFDFPPREEGEER